MVDIRKDALWSVYLHIIPKEVISSNHDMYYVGTTRIPPHERWGTNGCNYHRKEDGCSFGNIIDEVGWDNIEHEIIASNLTSDEARAFERTMIKKLKAFGEYGYNYSNGGDCSPKTVASTSKKVFQFDTQGKYIATYPSVQEASRQVKISAAAICKYAQGKSKLYGCTLFMWAYEDGVKIIDGEYHLIDESILRYDLYQFDLNGNYIARYPSIAEAARVNNIDYDTLYNQTHNNSARKLTQKDKYLWRKARNVYFKDGTYHMKIKKFTGAKEVFQFTSTGEYYAKYSSISEASLKTQLKIATIRARAEYQTNKVKDGMIFRFREDVKELDDGSFLMLR